MANNNAVPSPVLPLPPTEYDIQYMNNLIRLLNFYIQQENNAGAVRGTTAVLTTLPTAATGLEPGSLWRDTSTTPNTIRVV